MSLYLVVGNLYSLRNWIEYGFKQVKNELGWADRLTDYTSIERWWEIIFSAYWLISWQAQAFKNEASRISRQLNFRLFESAKEFERHPYWESGINWKSALNNLRLIIQPYIFWCLIEPWLRIFPIPGMKRSFFKLIEIMNGFRASPVEYVLAS